MENECARYAMLAAIAAHMLQIDRNDVTAVPASSPIKRPT